MQVVKSIRISLTMDDIIQNVSLLTKQQIVQKFRLLLDRKQIEINEKIQSNNAQHLLVLQKKMLILQRKDDQIVKLNNTISTYKNQLHDQKNKNAELQEEAMENKLKAIHFEKKYNEFDSIFKEQKAKKQKLKKQYQKLQIQFKTLSEEHSLQVRNHKKIKQQKTNWQQQTQLLLNNMKKGSQLQMQQRLKNIQLNFENKIAGLTQTIQQTKSKYESYKQKYLESKVNVANLNKAIQLLNKQLLNQKTKQKKNIKQFANIDTQTTDQLMESAFTLGTLFKKQFLSRLKVNDSQKIEKKEQPKVDKVDKQVQVELIQMPVNKQCQQCKELKIQIQNLQSQIKALKPKQKKVQKPKVISMTSQTNPAPVKYYNNQQSQTIFNPLPKEQQIELLNSFKIIVKNSKKLVESQRSKYEEMEKMFLDRPSKLEDRQKIGQLQKKIVEMQIKIMSKVQQISRLQKLINQLNHKIYEQSALLNQFNMSDLQITSASINEARPDSGFWQNKATMNRKQSRIRVSQINQSSYTVSFRQSKMQRKSLSPRISSKNRNYSNSQTYMTIKNRTQSISPQATGHYQNKQGQLQNILLEKGISFRPKVKEQNDQISQVRQYKKYKGSLKKVRL